MYDHMHDTPESGRQYSHVDEAADQARTEQPSRARPTDPPSDGDLIVIARTSCIRCRRNASEELYRRWQVPLYRLARRFGLTRDQSADAVHDGFLSIMEDLAYGRGPKGEPLAWALRILKNLIISDIRRGQTREKYVHRTMHDHQQHEARCASDPEVSLMRLQQSAAINDVLSRQPKRRREVGEYMRDDPDGANSQVIGKALGICDDTVRRHRMDLRKALRRLND